MIINEKITQLTYTGNSIQLSSSSFIHNIKTIYSINSSGLGYVSYSKDSEFNSLSTLESGRSYIIESVPENLPWTLESCIYDGKISTSVSTKYILYHWM